MLMDIRGHVSGFVDGEIRGVICGDVNAMIESKADSKRPSRSGVSDRGGKKGTRESVETVCLHGALQSYSWSTACPVLGSRSCIGYTYHSITQRK